MSRIVPSKNARITNKAFLPDCGVSCCFDIITPSEFKMNEILPDLLLMGCPAFNVTANTNGEHLRSEDTGVRGRKRWLASTLGGKGGRLKKHNE